MLNNITTELKDISTFKFILPSVLVTFWQLMGILQQLWHSCSLESEEREMLFSVLNIKKADDIRNKNILTLTTEMFQMLKKPLLLCHCVCLTKTRVYNIMLPHLLLDVLDEEGGSS